MSEAIELNAKGPRILTLDIETAPATALVFGQWKQDISNIQIIKRDRVIGIGAKWSDREKVEWRSEYHHGREVMISWIRDQIDQADIVVHFNGGSFDMPWIRREIAELGLAPHAPVREVDLLKVVKKQFRFGSYKLENMVAVFGAGLKMENGGFGLWRAIEVGDEDERRKAWTVMRKYCKQDVAITEQLYYRLRPFIPNHPHMGLFADEPVENSCSNCGGQDLESRGYRLTKVGKYRRYQCRDCGTWGSYKKALAMVDARSA